VGVGDHQFDAAKTATSEGAQVLPPEVFGFRAADGHAEDLAAAIVVDADRDGDGDGDDPAALADLYISGIQPDI